MNPIHRISLLLTIGLTIFSARPLMAQNTQAHPEYLAETETGVGQKSTKRNHSGT